MRSLRIILLAVCLLSFAGALFGQFGRFGGFGRSPINNDPAETEFIFSRWRYSGGSGGWNHDYPYAEEHLNQIMSESTSLDVEQMSYKFIDIISEEIFDYPFGYISEPGGMWLNELEVEHFREYIDRGGFVMIDDFDGRRDFEIMYENMKRVFPDREPYVLTDDHPMLNTFYNIDNLYVESPYAVGGPAVFYGIDDDFGNLVVVICYNNDVGDFWEHIDQPRYALKPSTEALRLGTNIVLYAMSH